MPDMRLLPPDRLGAEPVWRGAESRVQKEGRPLASEDQPAMAPCGVGMLHGGGSECHATASPCAQQRATSARCDCGQHTFVVLPPPPPLEAVDDAEGAAATHAERSPDPSTHTREKRGRVLSGDTPVSSSRRHLALPESENLAGASGPADIESISASMVKAMTRQGSTGTGPSQAMPSPAPSTPQQQHQPVQQQLSGDRRRGSVSGADGDRTSSLLASSTGSVEPDALSLNRIVVEPNGDMVVVESSVVCDACPGCDDVCTLPDCRGCQEKRERLLAHGYMVVLEAWGRSSRKQSMQQRDQHGGGGSDVCMPIIVKPRAKGDAAVSYSLCEIRRHRTLASCWLVAKGQVYDATAYLSSHPAGAIAIARKAGGVDCSEDFEFHSGKAQKLWKHLRIGSVCTCPAANGEGGAASGARVRRESSGGSLVGSSCNIM